MLYLRSYCYYSASTYLVEQLLVPTPLEAFYLYRAEQYTIVAERARTQLVFPQAGSHASDDIAYCGVDGPPLTMLYIHYVPITMNRRRGRCFQTTVIDGVATNGPRHGASASHRSQGCIQGRRTKSLTPILLFTILATRLFTPTRGHINNAKCDE